MSQRVAPPSLTPGGPPPTGMLFGAGAAELESVAVPTDAWVLPLTLVDEREPAPGFEGRGREEEAGGGVGEPVSWADGGGVSVGAAVGAAMGLRLQSIPETWLPAGSMRTA